MKNLVAAAVAALVFVAAAVPATAQPSWPEKPVKLVVGFTAGSATDVTARMFAQKFQEAWGQPVVVETSPETREPSGPTASQKRHPTATR